MPLRFEILEPRTLLAADFGDAPAPYPTLFAENGARHEDTGPTLGATRDSEANGAHSATANADGDDEDGVTFGGTIRVGALDAAVTVNVQGGAAKLDAWIDFDGDGNWGGLGERIFASRAVAVGNNHLTFDVPSWAKDGTTFARFRLSTAGGLGPKGNSVNGEVKDHSITISPPTEASGGFNPQATISASSDGARSVYPTDLDADGDMDLVCASEGDKKLVWHENDGSQGFAPHTISTGATEAKSVFVADVDGDDDLDVLCTTFYSGSKVTWYENNGSQGFTPRTISARAAVYLFPADIDGDGDVDVVTASFSQSLIHWYENDGSPDNGAWTERLIFDAAQDSYSVFAADVDTDGDMDVLSASKDDNTIRWYENAGNQTFTARIISDSAKEATAVFAVDMEGDGDVDVLSGTGYDTKVTWYENDGNQAFTARTISDLAVSEKLVKVVPADIDGDGDQDVVTASKSHNRIAWYENDGAQTFTQRTITTAINQPYTAIVGDLDGDGDLDVASASYQDDKIAWYENRNHDFGDAPSPYPTTLLENGPQHIATATGPILGATRDSERDGVPSSAADADGADEDGVSFGTLRVGEVNASLTVNVQGGPAKLDAWIDFNRDGVWSSPGEQIFAARDLVVGDNSLTCNVPGWANPGTTFARFRLSSAGGLDPDGIALDGEVEDYAVAVLPRPAASGVFESERAVASAANGVWSMFAADMDGDGDQDALTASSYDDTIAWHENDGAQNFSPHTITTSANGARSVFAADVDGDGDQDVLSASYVDDKIAWYENDGSQTFTVHVISTVANGARSVFATDVDGDGDLDVLSASNYDDKIAWYENDGSQSFTERTITTVADGAYSVFVADVDWDGDQDVLSASRADNTIRWYENDGSQNFTPHVIWDRATSALSVTAADVDSDGDMDVLSASSIDWEINWYENDGSQTFLTREINDSAQGASSVIATDVDGDGDMDVVSASAYNGKVEWYRNNGIESFAVQPIATLAGVRSVLAADMDWDGVLDVLAASPSGDKVVWYKNLGFDFGDAPAPYPTTLAENGPLHIDRFSTLGPTRDNDADGMHSPAANAETDENGVTWGTLQAGSLAATLTVNVQGGAARLDAWLDFNGDGSWGGPGEQIFASRSVAAGDNQLTFAVPSWAKQGTTYARFRLSTAGGLGPGGQAPDGEVEDYAVTISPPGPTTRAFSAQPTVTTAANGATAVFAADMDSDGDLDLLSASRNDSKLAWYENNGSQIYTPHTITTADSGAYSVMAADVDGDGDMDVLSASFNDDKIAWYENVGNQNFTAHTISTAADGAQSVYAADMDGDGDLDALSASSLDDKIAWYENDGNQSFTARIISTAADGAFAVSTADVDGDGDLDVLSASSFGSKIDWYENSGAQSFTAHTIATPEGARSIWAVDLDRDGDLDILSAASIDDKIAWHENNGDQSFSPHTISNAANGASSVCAADMDGDGDWDVLSASYVDGKIAWYENNGSQAFSTRTISNKASGARSVMAVDINGDGDLDVLSASFNDDKIAWYAQNSTPTLAANAAVTVAEGSRATIGAAKLSASDRDNTAGQLVYTITTSPLRGQLELTTKPGNAISTFTQAQIDAGMVRYQHDGSETTTDSFNFTVNDGVGGILSTTTFQLVVTPASGAPVLNTALNPTLFPVPEDATNPANTLVSKLLSGAVTDPNAGALSGIAVTAASSFNGAWQYSLNGTTWTAMGAPSSAAARLLPSSARLRFLPKLNFNGTVQLFYRAWDRTAGTAGGTLNVAGNRGGAKSLSYAQESATLTVTPTNDAPVLNAALTPSLGSISEESPSPIGTLVGSLLSNAETDAVTDVDVGAVRGIAVIVASNFNGVWQYSLNGGGTWTGMGAPSATAARLLPDTARVRFLPKVDFNGTVTLMYRAWDRTAGAVGGTLNTTGNTGGSKSLSTATESVSLSVAPVNDKPVLGVISGTVIYERGAAALTVAPFATVSDVDSFNFADGQLRVRITDGASSSNRLAFGSGFTVDAQGNVKQGTTVIGKRTSNGIGTNELLITFNSKATRSVVQQLVRAISFKTDGGFAGLRKLVFSVADGDGGTSADATMGVDVI